ncbi:MAG: hypothetical protein A2Y92_04035 [Chloroflexi bacterium RBG_13_57_8]|nr:MAG: hypothetical protein A2Y92_04035 [Chloroflexi bacterium RBG_13_57_8]
MTKRLSPREIQILWLLSEGQPPKAIGNRHTVTNTLTQIRLKLDALSTIHAVALAIRRGII